SSAQSWTFTPPAGEPALRDTQSRGTSGIAAHPSLMWKSVGSSGSDSRGFFAAQGPVDRPNIVRPRRGLLSPNAETMFTCSIFVSEVHSRSPGPRPLTDPHSALIRGSIGAPDFVFTRWGHRSAARAKSMGEPGAVAGTDSHDTTGLSALPSQSLSTAS